MAVSDKIFTRTTVKRVDLMETVIQILINAGWQQLNTNTTNSYIMSSTGVDGLKKLLIEICPYDGAQGAGNIQYDVRAKTRASLAMNAAFRLIKSYDATADKVVPYGASAGGWKVFPFSYSRRGDDAYTLSSNLYQFVPPDQTLDLWYYADKDRLIYFIENPRYAAGYYNMLFFLGVPEEFYMTEDFTGELPTNFVTFHTGSSSTTSTAMTNQLLSAQRPRAFASKATDWFQEKAYVVQVPRVPNIDKQLNLVDAVYGGDDMGIRSRLGGFLIAKVNLDKVADGDILNVQVGSAIHKYKYCVTPAGYNGNWTSMPSGYGAIAFRVE